MFGLRTSDSAKEAFRIKKPPNINPEAYFILIEKIGKGAFGRVYKGIVKDTKENVAVKVINLEDAKDEVDEIQNEISYLSQCRHPNVIAYHQSLIKGEQLWLVMELLVGSAADLTKPKDLGPYPEADIAILSTQVLSALEYLHFSGILHRDLKGANILISAEGDAKLADFGVAGTLGFFKPSASSFAGTPHYMAPEVIRQTPYNSKADIWSFGITLIELAKGNPPYFDQPQNRAMQAIANNPPPELVGEFSKNFKDFVARCLVVDPSQRPPAGELLKDKFVKGIRKRKDFLQPRIERFIKWRHTGGDSDSSDSDASDIEEDGDLSWDFSPDPPSREPKPQPEQVLGTDWITKLKTATKAQRKAVRTPKSKNKKKR